MNTELVIFIHIPKAGGQTIRSIVARQYARYEILAVGGRLGQTRIPPHDARRIKFAIGHVHHGFHQQLRGASSYVTLIREPVSRVLSLYRYIVTNPEHHLHEHVVSERLVDFVSGDVDADEVENAQTRQIAGMTDGSPDASSLLRAKQNLESFVAVGLVERFDESIVLFKRRLGWTMPFYLRKNVTQRLPNEEVSKEALGIIRDRNTLDTELYGFGRDLFEAQIRREGPLFGVEVALFQTLNGAARAFRTGREWTHMMTSKGGDM